MSWGIIHLAGPLPLILLKEGIWGTGHGPWPPSTNGCWHGGLWRGQELTPVCQLMDQPWQTTSSTTGASNNWTSARKGLTSTCTTSRCSYSYIRWRIGRSWLWCRWCCWTRSGWWTSRQGSCSTWWSRDGDLGGKFEKTDKMDRMEKRAWWVQIPGKRDGPFASSSGEHAGSQAIPESGEWPMNSKILETWKYSDLLCSRKVCFEDDLIQPLHRHAMEGAHNSLDEDSFAAGQPEILRLDTRDNKTGPKYEYV